jgi:hypothetical protein
MKQSPSCRLLFVTCALVLGGETVTAATSASLAAPLATHAFNTRALRTPVAQPMHAGRIRFYPSAMVRFHRGDKAQRSVVAVYGSAADSTTFIVQNTCGSGGGAIALIDGSASEYGIWGVTPGSVNGKCEFTLHDANGNKGKVHIVNKSN